jgi:hypothetical protein
MGTTGLTWRTSGCFEARRLSFKDRGIQILQSRKMVLLEVAPGKSARHIQEKVGFALHLSPNLDAMPEPTEKDLKLLREVCDPEGYFLARKVK